MSRAPSRTHAHVHADAVDALGDFTATRRLIAVSALAASAERKTLLVAGAAAGMSATFASPVAAVLLAVELLLFEWKPRSFVPVAVASATAAAARVSLLGMGPLFPVPPHPAFIGVSGLAGCALAGLLAGVLSAGLTAAVYAAEDAFAKLPIHWMWRPALGGLVIGGGGLLFPQALGVGYGTIGALVQGDVPTRVLIGILVVKAVIWSVALGSGTSGGVLAPLLMMGGALGGVEAWLLPDLGAGFWPLVSMGAILGGTMRAPLTGVIFALRAGRASPGDDLARRPVEGAQPQPRGGAAPRAHDDASRCVRAAVVGRRTPRVARGMPPGMSAGRIRDGRHHREFALRSTGCLPPPGPP